MRGGGVDRETAGFRNAQWTMEGLPDSVRIGVFPLKTADGAATKKKRHSDSVTGGSLGSLSEGYAANQSDDLGTAC